MMGGAINVEYELPIFTIAAARCVARDGFLRLSTPDDDAPYQM